MGQKKDYHKSWGYSKKEDDTTGMILNLLQKYDFTDIKEFGKTETNKELLGHLIVMMFCPK